MGGVCCGCYQWEGWDVGVANGKVGLYVGVANGRVGYGCGLWEELCVCGL